MVMPFVGLGADKLSAVSSRLRLEANGKRTLRVKAEVPGEV